MTSFRGLAYLSYLPFAVVVNAAIGPVADLHITNENMAPDGFNRTVVVAGGTMPGPLIKGNIGDRFQINVHDHLTEEVFLKSTSIHWHGLFQHGSAWADGPAFVTQCPITTNNSFLYDFTVPDQAGTFWYHSHLTTQYCDGLRGPMVVYDPNDPHKDLYDVDDGELASPDLVPFSGTDTRSESTVISLTEWYHQPASQFTGPPTPDSTLINGLGRFLGGPTSDLAVITVEQGKRYRFRLVSMACEPNFNFTIDNHEMTVIEADSVNTQSLRVDRLQIFAAQRYSFILNANQPVGNYWIRALPTNVPNATFDGGLNSAILRYVGAPAQDPTTTMHPNPVDLRESDLHPFAYTPVPGKPYFGGADVNKVLKFAFDSTARLFTVNGVSFKPPPVPVLLQILNGTQNPHDLLPVGSVIPLPLNATVELQMPGGVVGGGHPIHLHGHNFWVIQSAGNNKPNFNDPVIRDTVNIGTTGDNVTIRFQACFEASFLGHSVPNIHIKGTKAANPVPPAWDQLCPTFDALPPSDQ
ncbi:hypothetical protein NLI96_g7060 [Meripilus lineatus]|uniref:laccase n=1 Tax=Meripilus lineatus TaxID=2056292 RepID=A0AAD5V245_9APHY|nr:hypothetical protein NLI96_g7060 [Physisporinus lineatus]